MRLSGRPIPPLMGPPGVGDLWGVGLGLFALVRRSAGQGHAQGRVVAGGTQRSRSNGSSGIVGCTGVSCLDDDGGLPAVTALVSATIILFHRPPRSAAAWKDPLAAAVAGDITRVRIANPVPRVVTCATRCDHWGR